MADKTCRFISNRVGFDSPSSIGDHIYEGFILPTMNKHFPEYTTYSFTYGDEPGPPPDPFPEPIENVDIVIADLSALNDRTLFELGMRHQSGRPIVFISEAGIEALARFEGFRVVEYRQDSSADGSDSEEELVAVIREALDAEKERTAPTPSQRTLPPKQARAQLVKRILEAAEAVRTLRINSAMATIAELEAIAHDLEAVPEDKIGPALQTTVENFLQILVRFSGQLATVRGTRMLISGVISVVLGGAGFSAAAVFALSLAFWEGKDAFLKAIEQHGKSKRK